ncbi:winged helix-turn-helix domain-containing protein [Thalassotalea ganghwensis]
MRWDLGEFIFDAHVNVLYQNEQEIILEPKVAELLNYFCQHPQRDISRDELMTNVWQGQVVSDSAINRIIVKLRKVLADNHKIKRFVVTVPKVGYRFAYPVVEAGSELARNEKEKSANKPLPLVSTQQSSNLFPLVSAIVVTVILIITLFAFYGNESREGANKNANVTPLLRLAKRQYHGAMSLDGNYLAYVTQEQSNNRLHVLNQTTGEVSIVSQENGEASSPYWSDSGEKLFYIYRSQQGCQFHVITLINGEFDKPNMLYQCPRNSFTELSYDDARNTLYFVERADEYAPYQAYQLNLTTGAKQLLSQPFANGDGNYSINRHRQSSQLLLLSEQEYGQIHAYRVDAKEATFERLLTLPYRVQTAVWDHEMLGIVHPGEHPSYNLVRSDLRTGQQVTILTDSRRIRDVNRIENGRDYLFTSYINNRDIAISGKVVDELNSSVMDYLPAYAHDGEQLAFISKRSGYSKLWISNVAGELFSIEPAERGRLYFDLKWSYDNRYILANTDSGLLLYDVKQRKAEPINQITSQPYVIGWLDNHTLFFTVKRGEQWQLQQHHLATNTLSDIQLDWAFISANREDRSQWLYIDQQMVPHWQQQTIDTQKCPEVLQRKRITYVLEEGDLYCRSAYRNQIYKVNLAGDYNIFTEQRYVPPVFDISGEDWVSWQVTSNFNDLLRTNF